MRARFIVRLLDASHELLAWATVEADAKPQERGASCPFFAPMPTRFVIERAGEAALITVHWPDLDVARQQAILEAVPVEIGQIFNFSWMEPVWLVAGMRNVPLPAVTVREPIVINVPTGAMGMVDPRIRA